MEIIEATLNQDLKVRCGEECFSFEHHDKNFDQVIKHCKNCKFLDEESDFPNRFCDKNNDMIDYWFCTGKCPLGKFELIDKNLNKGEDLKRGYI